MSWKFCAVFQWLFISSIFIWIGTIYGFPRFYLIFMGIISYIFAGLDLRNVLSDLLTPAQSFKLVIFWLPGAFSGNILKWILC